MLRLVDDRDLALIVDSMRDGYTSAPVQEAMRRLRAAPPAPPPANADDAMLKARIEALRDALREIAAERLDDSADDAAIARDALDADEDFGRRPIEQIHPRHLRDILDQQKRQAEKWGEQNHDPFVYGAILVEEVGEFAQAVLQSRFGGPKGGADAMRTEAVQIAAVAIDIVACLDRDKWPWGSAALLDPERDEAVAP